MVNFAINGFGRIGRSALRVWLDRQDLHDKMVVTAVNTSGSMDVKGWAHMLKYDSNYGQLGMPIKAEDIKTPKEVTESDPLIGYLHIGDNWLHVPVFAQRDPEKIPWGKYAVDVVIESTGAFTDETGASKHLKGGARRVVISAPSKGGSIQTCVIGVNYYNGTSPLVDNASCTTNCISPVATILHERFTILKAALNTTHAYTDDQSLQDASHKDLRRARAAAKNTVPTTTGAAIATTRVIPDLVGKFDGISLRVPVSVGSISDVTALLGKKTTVEEVNQAFRDAANSDRWRGILAVTDEPLVSSDIVGRRESSIVDLDMTQVIDGDLVKVLAWYDNEWGYCNRLVEQTHLVGSR